MRTLRTGFLATRVGRRMLLHFLIAAMLPVLAVSAFGVWSVRRTLVSETADRVDRTAKLATLTILGELSSGAATFAQRPPVPDEIVGEAGWSPAERRHLDDGRVLLRLGGTNGIGDDAAILLYKRTSDGAIARDSIPARSLWLGLDERFDQQRAGYCVYALESRRRIHCSPDLPARDSLTIARLAFASTAVADDASLIAARRDLFLRVELGSGDWRLVLAESRADALAPVGRTMAALLVILALAAACAFFFAHLQIRRSTQPLEALRDATRRVAEGDLTTPVRLDADDEFGELGRAFDQMTGVLSRQLLLLGSMDALDQAALRQRKVEAIVTTALDGLLGAHGCREAAIAIVRERERTRVDLWRSGARGAPAAREERVLSPDEHQALLAEPRQLASAPPPACVRPRLPGAPVVVLPLLHDDELIGLVALTVDDEPALCERQAPVARRLADRVALAVGSVRLLERLDALSSGTLRAFARAIDANSHWTAGHSERVTHLALAIGAELGLPRPAMATLYRGGMLHDIGKISIPPALLDKPGALELDERLVIQRHPEVGERILAPITVFADALPIVRSHHEKLDGTGYPDGLAGSDIPWLARVLAVADVYDALVSDRPYRAGMTQEVAVSIITRGAGTHFDPAVVHAFLALDLERAMADVELDLDVEAMVRGTARPPVRLPSLTTR